MSIRQLLTAIGISSILVACDASDPNTPTPALAVYDGGEFTVEDLDAYVAGLPASQRVVDAEDPQAWWQARTREAVLERLLAHEMDLLDIRNDPNFQRLERAFVRDALVAEWLQEELKNHELTEQELMDLYEANRSELVIPGARLVGNIFLPYTDERDRSATSALAEDLYDRLSGGAAFSALAEQYSASETRYREGIMGWLQRDELAPELAEILWALPLNEVSRPAVTAQGVHLFIVINERQASELSLNEARTRLVRDWSRQTRREIVDGLATGLTDIFVPTGEELMTTLRQGSPDAIVLRINQYALTAAEFRNLFSSAGVETAEQTVEFLRNLADREIIFQTQYPGATTADLSPAANAALDRHLVAAYRNRQSTQWLNDNTALLQQHFQSHENTFRQPRQIAVEFVAAPLGQDPTSTLSRLIEGLGAAGEPASVTEALDGRAWTTPLQPLPAFARSDRRLVRALDDVPTGHWSAPYRIGDQLLAARIIDERPATTPTLDEVRRDVAAALMASEPASVYDAYSAAVFDRYNARFDYSGLERLVPGAPGTLDTN